MGLSATSASCFADVEWNPASLCRTCWDAGKVSYTILHPSAQEGASREAVWHGGLFEPGMLALRCSCHPLC